MSLSKPIPYVYVLTDDRAYKNGQGIYVRAYKIGKSENGKERIKDLSKQETFCNEKIEVGLYIKTTNPQLETELHRHFKQQRVQSTREWFLIELSEIKEFLKNRDDCSLETFNNEKVEINYNHYIRSTGKELNATSGNVLTRIPLLRSYLNKNPFSTGNQIIKQLDCYSKGDLKYDIEHLYFECISDSCEICGTDTDVGWFCKHSRLCTECAGGGVKDCYECNPNGELYTVETDLNGQPQMVFG